MPRMHAASPGEVQVFYTYCHLVHAGSVDHELGWVAEELTRHGARLSYLLSVPEPDFYPHYTHGLESLFRFGGCIPAIHVRADLVDTVLLGLQWFWEGGGMLVRADDEIGCMADLAGRRVGFSKSLNAAKVDYRRVTEERGLELLLRLHDMRREDLRIVDRPFPDDWYEEPRPGGTAAGPPRLLARVRRAGRPAAAAAAARARGRRDRRLLRHRSLRSRVPGSPDSVSWWAVWPASQTAPCRSVEHRTPSPARGGSPTAPGAGDRVSARAGPGRSLVQRRPGRGHHPARGDRVLPAGRDDAPCGGASRPCPEPLHREPERTRCGEGVDARTRPHRQRLRR